MENRDNQDSGQSPDVSKASQAKQPQNERSQPPEGSQSEAGKSSESAFDQAQPPETAQEGFGEDQSDTTTQQRSDIEGSSLGQTGGAGSDIEGSSSFVGSEGSTDTSSELVEDEDKDFAKGDGE